MAHPDTDRVIDRADLTDLLSAWAHAIDFLEWGILGENVFAENVTWDWTASDGTGSLSAVTHGATESVAWFASAIKPDTQIRHVLTNHAYRIDHESAEVTSYMQLVDGASMAIAASGLVMARCTRTGAGWRIAHLRVDEKLPPGVIERLSTDTAS